MLLDTQGGSTSLTATAIRRMTRRDALVEWKTRLAWTADNANFMRYLRFSMDYENNDNRYWFDVRYENYSESSAAISPKWEVNTGATSAMVFATSSVTFQLPYNQRQKLNYTDVTIRFDTLNKKYGNMTINGVTHSLGSVGPTAGPKLSEPDTYFTNGMNLLFNITGRSNNSNADPRLYVGYTAGVVT